MIKLVTIARNFVEKVFRRKCYKKLFHKIFENVWEILEFFVIDVSKTIIVLFAFDEFLQFSQRLFRKRLTNFWSFSYNVNFETSINSQKFIVTKLSKKSNRWEFIIIEINFQLHDDFIYYVKKILLNCAFRSISSKKSSN